jgi:hypothetical protein
MSQTEGSLLEGFLCSIAQKDTIFFELLPLVDCPLSKIGEAVL